MKLDDILKRPIVANPQRHCAIGPKSQFTYSGLEQAIDHASGQLADAGLQPGMKVALIFPLEPDFLPLFFAVLRNGAIPSPLNPEANAHELRQILDVVKPSAIITSSSIDPDTLQVDDGVALIRIEGEGQGNLAIPSRIPACSVDDALTNVAVILCSSGTTRLPKAAMLTHQNVVSNLGAFRDYFEFWPGRTWLEHEIFGLRAEIRDESGHPLPPGQSGELWMQGVNIFKGYYRNPELTAATLQEGWLRSGDIGSLDEEGHLYLLGRAKEMMIVSGHNVYPKEIESALLHLPCVADVAVASVQDAKRGEAVVAFVVPTEGASPDKESILAHCRNVLSPYKVPREISFVASIPRNATGKILRKELL